LHAKRGASRAFCVGATACQPRIGEIAGQCYMAGMFPDLYQLMARIVIDDHSRLPGRFFGRFTTGVAAELRKL
jgi:hypothetical protein